MQQPAELFVCLCVCVKTVLYVCLCVCTDSILRFDWGEHGEVLERAQGAYRAAHDDYDCECMNQGMHASHKPLLVRGRRGGEAGGHDSNEQRLSQVAEPVASARTTRLPPSCSSFAIGRCKRRRELA